MFTPVLNLDRNYVQCLLAQCCDSQGASRNSQIESALGCFFILEVRFAQFVLFGRMLRIFWACLTSKIAQKHSKNHVFSL